MARKSAKPPEGESSVTESAVTINKAAAIRRALAEGLTKYEDAAPFIKSQFGHDVSPGHFAASKSREKPPGEPVQEAPRRGRPPGKGKGVTVTVKRGRKPKAAVESAPPKPRTAKDDILAEMEALKPLVESMGKEKAHRIIELLG